MKIMNKLEAKDGKLCMINTEADIVLEPKVEIDTLYFPSHGLCQVGKNGKYGYMDEHGELVIPMKYKKVSPFSENGLAFVVRDNGLGGYIDQNDNFIIHPIYETGSTFKFGFAAVSRNGDYTFIYENGNKAVDHTFKYASGFSANGLAKIQEFDGRQGLMDTTSKPVLTLKKGCELAEFKGESKITTFRVKNRKALINSKGDIITGFKFEKVFISPYSPLHPFLRNGLWGYIDEEGNEVIANIYREVSDFTEFGVASVKSFHPLAKNNLVNLYINERDEIIDNRLIDFIKQLLRRQFSKVSPFRNGIALAVRKTANKPVSLVKNEYVHKTQSCENVPENCLSKEKDNSKKLYEVHVYFKAMKKFQIYDLLKNLLKAGRVRVLDVKNNYVNLLWPLENNDNPADIEKTMNRILHRGDLGVFDYVSIN